MTLLLLAAAAAAQDAAPPPITHAPRSLAELPSLSEYERNTSYAADDLPAQVLFSGGYKQDNWTETRFTVTRRIKIFDVQGMPYADFAFRTRLFETVEAVEGRTLHPDGRVSPLDPERDGRRSITYDALWGPEIVHRFRLPEAGTGAIIEYRYTIATQLGPGLRFNYWFLQDWVSTLRTVFTLDMPSDFMPFSAGIENLSSSAVPEEEEKDGRRLISWNFAEIPGLRIEPYMPPPSFLKARLVVDYEWTASSASEPVAFWSQVGRAQALRQRRFMEGVPGVEALARKLQLEKLEIRDRMAAIVTWIRENILNLSAQAEEELEIDDEPDWEEGLTADEVLERGEGTALEITRLAVTLMRAAGIDAFLGLAVSRESGVLRYSFLDPQQFDVAFVAVRLPGDDVAFLQPGARYGPTLGISWRIQGALALICTPDRGFFARLPVDRAGDNRRETEMILTLGSDGDAEGIIRIRYRGQENMSVRERLDGKEAKDWQAWFAGWLGGILPEARLSAVTWNGDEADGITAEMRVSVPRFGVQRGAELTVDPALLTRTQPLLGDDVRRIHPVYLPYPLQEGFTLQLKLPEGTRAVLPGERTVGSDIGTFSSGWEIQGRELTWRRNFLQDRIFFDRGEARRLAAFLADVRGAEERQQCRIAPD